MISVGENTQFQWENTHDFSGSIHTISVGEFEGFQLDNTDDLNIIKNYI